MLTIVDVDIVLFYLSQLLQNPASSRDYGLNRLEPTLPKNALTQMSVFVAI